MSIERGREDNGKAAMNRRGFLKLASAAGAVSLFPQGIWAENAPATQRAGATLELARYPEKTDLILLTDRPPQLETPLKYFRSDLTANDAMFVRWHLSGIPTSVDMGTFRLNIKGHVQLPLSLSMEDLKKLEPVSVVAVNQCSGNSRSFFQPRVPGGQWQNGAVGNARFTGVRLKDLLAQAGVKSGAVDVSFQGLDRPVLPATPAFIKSLEFEHANDGEVMVAYAMNNEPLPMLNGFPLALIVPGWFATYWVKALNDITVLNEKFHGFWMDKAYRVPNNPEYEESPQELAKDTVPISKLLLRSFFVKPEPDEQVAAASPSVIEGVALDDGTGIKEVEVSVDGGKTWANAELGDSLGKYSWRRWRMNWTPVAGRASLQVRATNNAGKTQPTTQNWNRSGYARNVVEVLEVTVV